MWLLFFITFFFQNERKKRMEGYIQRVSHQSVHSGADLVLLRNDSTLRLLEANWHSTARRLVFLRAVRRTPSYDPKCQRSAHAAGWLWAHGTPADWPPLPLTPHRETCVWRTGRYVFQRENTLALLNMLVSDLLTTKLPRQSIWHDHDLDKYDSNVTKPKWRTTGYKLMSLKVMQREHQI